MTWRDEVKVLEGEDENVKPRKKGRVLLQQGDGLRDQGDNFGLNLEGKNVITGEQMSSGRDIKAVALGNLSPFILKGGHPPNGCAVTAERDGLLS